MAGRAWVNSKLEFRRTVASDCEQNILRPKPHIYIYKYINRILLQLDSGCTGGLVSRAEHMVLNPKLLLSADSASSGYYVFGFLWKFADLGRFAFSLVEVLLALKCFGYPVRGFGFIASVIGAVSSFRRVIGPSASSFRDLIFKFREIGLFMQGFHRSGSLGPRCDLSRGLGACVCVSEVLMPCDSN